jgi:multicomponent Na+:H+ antiporter subunit E
MSFVLTAIIMFAFWLLLSGEFTPILLGSGIVSSLLVAYISHDLLFGNARFGVLAGRFWRFLLYLPWLFKEIVVANFDLVYRTLHPKMPIDPEVRNFQADLNTDMGISMLANSITLTPGTVTMEAKSDGSFTVHSLVRGSDAEDMERRIKRIERGA